MGLPVPELCGEKGDSFLRVEALQLEAAYVFVPDGPDDLGPVLNGEGIPVLKQLGAEKVPLELVRERLEARPLLAQLIKIAAPLEESLHHVLDRVDGQPQLTRGPGVAHLRPPIKVR